MGVFCRTQRQDVQSDPMRDWYRTWGPPGLRLGSWVSSPGFSLGLLVSLYAQWLLLLSRFVTGLATSVSALCGPRFLVSTSLHVYIVSFSYFAAGLPGASLSQEWPPEPILPGISHPSAQHRLACLWFLFHIPERDLTEPACSAQASPTGQLSGR